MQQKLAEYPDLYQEAYRFLYLEEHYFDDNVDTDAVDKELEDIEQQFRDMGQEELFKEFRIAVLDRQNAQRRAEKSELSPTEAYTRTAGEVEARNAQKRANMSMEERRQMLLDETADVAPEDRIYIEQLLDSSMALFDNKEKSRKIISALQKIADGSEEETVPGLRNDLAQYGGTNDITFYWGNEKKGIYHIAYRRGVKTLFHVIDAVADGRILRHVDGNKTVILEKDGFEAVLALTEYGNQKSWLLSGWEVEQPDANGEVSTQSAATQSEPTFSRQELGAGLKGNIPQNPDNASLESKKTGRFSISPVWTGSAADYDKPSLHYIGTGEGAQAYGWGLYGSSEREIGEFYAKADARRKAQQEEVLFDGKSIHPDMAANLDEWESIKAAILWVKQNKGDIDAAISELQGYIDNGEDYSTDDIAFVQRAIDFLKNNRERILYVHASDLTGNRNLYSQTFFPDKEENLLDWDNPVPDQQMQMIADQGAKEGLPFVYSEDGKNVFNESNTSGMWVYEQLCKPYNGLGSPKAVSEFLYRAGIDGITYIGDSSGVRNYVAFSDEDIRIDEHIRFSLTGYSDQRIDDLVTVLRPFAGYVMNHSDAEYLEYFKSKGYDVESEADAHAFAVLAIAENKAAKLKAGRERRQAKILEDYPFIAHAMQLAGGDWNFKIVPSLKHYGEEFTGSFIAKEWKTKKSDKENTGVDAVSKNMKRKTKLENAKGVRSEELARQIAQVTGENENDVEQIIVDFFRDLTKPQLFNQYKNERELQDRQFREEAEEFRRSQESARINEEAAEFVKWGGDIMQLVKDDREVARKVYELIMGTPLNDNLRVVNPDGSTSAADWDAVTNALNSPEYADRHAIAKAWRDAYDQAEKIHEEEIRSLREKINADIENTVQLQREAQKYANRNLAPEQRAKFVGRIITLVRYSNIPTKNNPEGRRMREFYALLKEMAETGKQDRKNKAIERIRETVDKNRTKRTSKGVPTSILEDRQPIVDYIAQIVRWSPEVVAENRSYLAEDLAMYDDRLDGLIEDSEEYENAMADYARTENKIFLIDTFGALKLKTAEDAEKAELFLRNYIKNGKDAFVRKMEQRKEHNRQIREQLILEMHAGEIKDIPNKNELEKISKFTKKFIAEHLAVSDLIPLFSRTMDDVTFENSAHGRIMRMIEDSTEKEQSRIRNANEMFRQVLSDAGVISGTGSNLLNLRNMGKFINASRKVQKTNIYVTEYGAKSSEDGPVNWQAPRPFKQEMVPVEHARKILELINEGVHIDAVIPFDYSDVRSALKKNDIKTGRFVSLYLVNNDIMMLTENEDFEVVSTKIDRKLLPSVDDLISFDPEKLVPIEDLSIHEVESLIREYDSGAELGKSFFTGDDVDDASMKLVKLLPNQMLLDASLCLDDFFFVQLSDRVSKNVIQNQIVYEIRGFIPANPSQLIKERFFDILNLLAITPDRFKPRRHGFNGLFFIERSIH